MASSMASDQADESDDDKPLSHRLRDRQVNRTLDLTGTLTPEKRDLAAGPMEQAAQAAGSRPLDGGARFPENKDEGDDVGPSSCVKKQRGSQAGAPIPAPIPHTPLREPPKWLDEMSAWLDEKGISVTNKKNTMKVVRKLAMGEGIEHPSGICFFRMGQPVDIEDDIADAIEQGKKFLPKKEDTSNGWKLQHPLNKLRMFQDEYHRRRSNQHKNTESATPKRQIGSAGYDRLDHFGDGESTQQKKKQRSSLAVSLVASSGALRRLRTHPLVEALKTNETRIDQSEKLEDGEFATIRQAVADALKDNSTLTSLNLAYNWLGPGDVQVVADALKGNNTLKSLNLEGNMLEAEGGKAVADALEDNHTLTRLNLAWNKLGAEGGKAVANALKTNKTLRKLNLRCNALEAEGCKAVAVALKTNKTLTSLDLQENEFGAEIRWDLADALASNKTLTSLNLKGNQHGADVDILVAEVLKTNRARTSLDNIVSELQRRAQENPTTSPKDIEFFVDCLFDEHQNIREEAIELLGRTVSHCGVHNDVLQPFGEKLLTAITRKGETASAGLRVAALSPSLSKDMFVNKVAEWAGRPSDEDTVEKIVPSIQRFLSDAERKRCKEAMQEVLDALPQEERGAAIASRVLERLHSAQPANDSAALYSIDCTFMDFDGDVEQSVYQAKCTPSDSSLQELTVHLALPSTFEKGSANALKDALSAKFAENHPGKQLEDLSFKSFCPSRRMPTSFDARVVDREQDPPVLPNSRTRRRWTPQKDNQIHDCQWLVALELAERIRRLYGVPWCGLTRTGANANTNDSCTLCVRTKLYQDKFQAVDFIIFTANLNTVAEQTLKRVEGRRLCGDNPESAAQRVLRYSKPQKAEVLPNFTLFKERVNRHSNTLFVLIADECHWGALKDRPHDKYVNDPELCEKENVVVLLVSATPYCLLTRDSRLPKRMEASQRTQGPGPGSELDVHICSWQDTVERGKRFVHGTEDLNWLREEQLFDGSTSKCVYQSLDGVYLDPAKGKIRCDKVFERLMTHKAIQSQVRAEASKVLAVDYAFHMLAYCKNKSSLRDWQQAVHWLVEETPHVCEHRAVVKAYLAAQNVSKDKEGALKLITRWAEKKETEERNETREVVAELLNEERVRMQVLRVTDVSQGEKVLRFLRAVRRQLGLQEHFELLGDFKDLNIEKEMDQQWFESLQKDQPCQHRSGAFRKACTGGPDGGPCEQFSMPDKRKSQRKCAKCKCPAHVRIRSYGDLSDRSILLILVAKGRLGDTFPGTFHCLDMRARSRNDPPTTMMSTIVQELGRLCRHSKVGDENPYALVSQSLFSDLMPKEGYRGSHLLRLLKARGPQLDSHMVLEDQKQWEEGRLKCEDMEQLVDLMRCCCKARDVRDKLVADEDGAGSSRVICYDAKNRHRKPPTHTRRLMLFAEPQIGKTGAFLGLIEVLRLRLAPKPEEVELEENSDCEGGDISGGSFPKYAEMQEKGFQHTGGQNGTPKNGKYGDPAYDALWKHYMDGKRLTDAMALLGGGRGSTRQRDCLEKREGASAATSTTATGASQPEHELCNQVRYLTGPYEARRKVLDQTKCVPQKITIRFDEHNAGQLHLTSLEGWENMEIGPEKEPRLRDFEPEDGSRILFPILMPSSGRAQTARLDLRPTMQNHSYVQLVCVKKSELDAYRLCWPTLSFFELPESADKLGIGASRFWIMKLAQKICPRGFRFFFMMDDNVQAWKVCRTPGNSIFSSKLGHYPMERFKDGRPGHYRRDVPLCEVLAHFQSCEEFRDELRKFAMIGFDRLGRRPSEVVASFGRRHVYKAVIVNLDVIKQANYKSDVWVWEDLDFNLRISGMERLAGGHGKRLDEEVLKSSEDMVWVDQSSTFNDGQLKILDPCDPAGPGVICKCYGFAYYQDQSISKKGGCQDLPLLAGREGPSDKDSLAMGSSSPTNTTQPQHSTILALRQQLEIALAEWKQLVQQYQMHVGPVTFVTCLDTNAVQDILEKFEELAPSLQQLVVTAREEIESANKDLLNRLKEPNKSSGAAMEEVKALRQYKVLIEEATKALNEWATAPTGALNVK